MIDGSREQYETGHDTDIDTDTDTGGNTERGSNKKLCGGPLTMSECGDEGLTLTLTLTLTLMPIRGTVETMAMDFVGKGAKHLCYWRGMILIW